MFFLSDGIGSLKFFSQTDGAEFVLLQNFFLRSMVRYLIRLRIKYEKFSFSLKQAGRGKLKVVFQITINNDAWKKRKFFSYLDVYISVAKIKLSFVYGYFLSSVPRHVKFKTPA